MNTLQWISMVVTFAAAFAFGVLAHRSPKRDWEFIKGWPAFALFVISGTVAQMEQAPKWVPGEFKFNSFCVAGFAPRTGGNKAWNGCCGDAARLASTWLSRLRTTPKQLMKDRDDRVVKAFFLAAARTHPVGIASGRGFPGRNEAVLVVWVKPEVCNKM